MAQDVRLLSLTRHVLTAAASCKRREVGPGAVSGMGEIVEFTPDCGKLRGSSEMIC